MLHTNCGSCGSPLPLDRAHGWIGAFAVCKAECASALEASGKANASPEEHRAAALTLVSSARRANLQVSSLDRLSTDRSMRAGKIIGLTKGARREKRELLDEAREFSDQADSARYEMETSLVKLMGRLRPTSPTNG